MENDSFEKKLKEISIPDTGKINPPAELKMTLLSAKKTTAIGIWLIAIPVYFLFCVFMKYYLHINLHVFDIIIDTMASIDRQSGFHYLSPLLLVGRRSCVIAGLQCAVPWRGQTPHLAHGPRRP